MIRVVALAGAFLFIATLGLLHFIRSDISPLERGVSRYADGRTRPAATMACLALAVALLATGRGLPGSSWFVGAALGMVAAAATPVGLGPTRPFVGAMHALAACVFYPCVTVALFKALPASPLPRMALSALVVFALTVAVPSLRRLSGLAQRLFLLLVIAGIAIKALSRT